MDGADSSRPGARDLILTTAMGLFAGRGMRATSVGDIAVRADVSAAEVLRLFPGGKAEVVREVYRRVDDRLYAAMRAAVVPGHEPDQQLRAIVLAKLEGMRSVIAEHRAGLELATELQRDVRIAERPSARRELDLLTEVIGRGQEEGRFRGGDPVRLARLFQATIRQLQFPLAFRLIQPELEERVDELLDLLLYGLVSTPPRDEASD